MRARSISLAASITALGALAAVACATLVSQTTGETNSPSSGVGPFRKLGGSEVIGVAPFVMHSQESQYREPAAMPLDDDPASTRVAMYATATIRDDAGARDVIIRSRADDARSFYGDGNAIGASSSPPVVLTGGADWEGASVASPSAVRAGAIVYLYYASSGGIGVASSNDGFAFTKNGAPVLARDPNVAWETSAPSAPSVAVFPDGTWHLFYAAGDAIGEATSADGIAWTRVDGDPTTPAIDPILAPSPTDPAHPTLDAGAAFDVGQVTDPCVTWRTTPAGRLQVRVLYTGYDASSSVVSTTPRSSAIGLAARYDLAGPLVRASTVVYSVSKHEAAPALFAWSTGSMLYVHEDFASGASSPAYPAIAAAFAPANQTLPTPTAAADGP